MRRVSTLLLALGLMLALAVPVSAKKATCSDSELVDVEVHGHHIVADYATGVGHVNMVWPPAGEVNARGGAALPGGPGPGFHFGAGFAPGASFCIDANSSVVFDKNPNLPLSNHS